MSRVPPRPIPRRHSSKNGEDLLAGCCGFFGFLYICLCVSIVIAIAITVWKMALG